MKKTITIFLILASVIATSIYSYIDVEKKCNSALNETKKIEENLNQENIEFLKNIAKNLKTNWNSSSNILQLFLKRENLKLLEKEILNQFVKEVPSFRVAEITMKKLKNVDIVAYIRFASVYYEFSTAEEFIKEINRLNYEK